MTPRPARPTGRQLAAANMLTSIVLAGIGILIGGWWGGLIFACAMPFFLVAMLILFVLAIWGEEG